MNKVFVDVDSKTVKVYRYEDDKIDLVLEKDIDFLGNFDPIRGLHFNDEEALVRLLERVAANYFAYKIELFARGIFSELKPEFLDPLKSEILKRAKMEMQIVSEDD